MVENIWTRTGRHFEIMRKRRRQGCCRLKRKMTNELSIYLFEIMRSNHLTSWKAGAPSNDFENQRGLYEYYAIIRIKHVAVVIVFSYHGKKKKKKKTRQDKTIPREKFLFQEKNKEKQFKDNVYIHSLLQYLLSWNLLTQMIKIR